MMLVLAAVVVNIVQRFELGRRIRVVDLHDFVGNPTNLQFSPMNLNISIGLQTVTWEEKVQTKKSLRASIWMS